MAPTVMSTARPHRIVRPEPSTNAPAMITARATRFGAAHRKAAAYSLLPRSMPSSIVANPINMITPRETAKTGPPGPNAVEIAAAIGTLATVATRKKTRTMRPLPETALADQVNCCHGNHNRRKRSVTCPTPSHVGSAIRRPTSWEKANT